MIKTLEISKQKGNILHTLAAQSLIQEIEMKNTITDEDKEKAINLSKLYGISPK